MVVAKFSLVVPAREDVTSRLPYARSFPPNLAPRPPLRSG